MVKTPPDGMQRITPYLLYEDLGASLEWISLAFGFSERSRVNGPDGRARHAEMTLDDGVIMMGQPHGAYESPHRHGHVCQTVYVYVDNVDAHCRQTESHGARIVSRPEDRPFGDRVYSAEDPEGHHWYFAQHVRDVPPEEAGSSS